MKFQRIKQTLKHSQPHHQNRGLLSREMQIGHNRRSKRIHLIPGRWVREQKRTAEGFDYSVHSGRALGLKEKEAGNSTIANSKES